MRALASGLQMGMLACTLLLGAAPHTAAAQTLGGNEGPAGAETQASELPAAYQRAVKLGLDEFELNNYAEARARFLEAHQIYPNARSLRALGMVEYNLQNYVESIDYLQSALGSDVRALSGALRAETEELLERARGYVATYTFQLEPKETALALDGERVSLRPDSTLLIKVGDHKLDAEAPGFIATRQTLHVVGRADTTLSIELAPAAKAEEEVPLRKKWWVWTLTGVVVAGAAVGLAVGLSGREKTGEPSESNLEGLRSVHAARF